LPSLARHLAQERIFRKIRIETIDGFVTISSKKSVLRLWPGAALFPS
jgi:hypothetical protein